MRKVKPVVHKSYQRERKPVDVFAAVFLSNAAPSPIPTLRPYVDDPRAAAGNGLSGDWYMEWDGQFGEYPYAINPYSK